MIWPGRNYPLLHTVDYTYLRADTLRFAMSFHLLEGLVILSVLWALGWSMIALSALIHLPVRVLAVVSVAVIALHHLVDGVSGGRYWNVLHQPGSVQVGGLPVLVAYPRP